MLQTPNNVFLVEPTPLPSNSIKGEQKKQFLSTKIKLKETFKHSREEVKMILTFLLYFIGVALNKGNYLENY